MAPKRSNNRNEKTKSNDKSVCKPHEMSSMALKKSNKGKEKVNYDDKSVFKVQGMSSATPKQSNKGKEEKKYDDNSVFKVPRMSSIGARVGFSKRIEGMCFSRHLNLLFYSWYNIWVNICLFVSIID
ncbi:hypothetical protein Hanom_Chr08g00752721 [Helianthus anomalus]